MGPSRNHGKNSAAFILFFVFTVLVAAGSSCQRAHSAENLTAFAVSSLR